MGVEEESFFKEARRWVEFVLFGFGGVSFFCGGVGLIVVELFFAFFLGFPKFGKAFSETSGEFGKFFSSKEKDES